MAATASPGAGGMDAKPRTSPKSVKFLFGGLAGMGATVFVQPLDLVKNRMQLSGEGAKTREYKTSFHALTSILRAEGLRAFIQGCQLACFARPPIPPLALVSIPCCLSA